MDRQDLGAQSCLRGLLIVLFLSACARAPTRAAVEPARDGVSGDPVALEARPSPVVAALLPRDARYRVVLAGDGTLAVVLVTPDWRIVGRLAVVAGAGPHGSPAVRVESEDASGRALRVEAWSSAGGLEGQAFVGERSAAWRVRYESDGSLAGEAWSVPQRGPLREAELDALRRTRAIGADLGGLASRLASSGGLDDSASCVLAERLALAELALELSVRAWQESGRARLPQVGVLDDPCPL